MNDKFRIRRALRQLGSEQADPESWHAIANRAEALGLFDEARVAASRSRWQWPLGLAAALLMAVAGLRLLAVHAPDTASVAALPHEEATIDALIRQSQLLEEMLRRSPPPPRVVTVGTASREAALRDRIAAIDWQLSDASDRLDPVDQARLWSERSQHMRELVALRYRDQPRSDL